MVLSSITIVIVLFIGWKIFKNFIPEYIFMRLTNFESYLDDVRFTLWSDALSFFKNSPLFGSGMNSSSSYLYSLGLHDSHNLYLDILIGIGQGLVGIILLGFVIIRFLHVKKSDRDLMILLVISIFGLH